MAIGLLGTGTVTDSYQDTLVYTVPTGISHAVVHITLCGSSSFSSAVSYGAVTVGGTVALSVALFAVTELTGWKFVGGTLSDSVSMMLGPGTQVRVAGQIGTACTVSGYEVE